MPGRLQALMVGLLLASLAWGAVTAWTVIQHSSAAHNVVSTSEPLSLSAQQMYRSLSDADVTASTTFLANANAPLAARQRYTADIARAAADLTSLKDAAAGSSNAQLVSSLAAVSAGMPVYTDNVARAQTWRSLGYPLTGGSFIQVASDEMHLTLLPAAQQIYNQENSALNAASARATGLPWIVAVVLLAIVLGFALFRVQRWLTRRTHRVVNYGLLAASLALVACTLWLAVAFVVARSDLQRGVGHGSTPAESLAKAAIYTQQIRADEVLNLISRSGDKPFLQDSQSVRHILGPGPGTLLTAAGQASPSGAGAQWAAQAASDEKAWYAVDSQVYNYDGQAQYRLETPLVTGTKQGSSGAEFSRVENDLSRAIAADQVTFHSGAAAGSNAYAGLDVGIIVAALIMVAGCAWGLSRRLAEYR
jgi:hypothetical protein